MQVAIVEIVVKHRQPSVSQPGLPSSPVQTSQAQSKPSVSPSASLISPGKSATGDRQSLSWPSQSSVIAWEIRSGQLSSQSVSVTQAPSLSASARIASFPVQTSRSLQTPSPVAVARGVVTGAAVGAINDRIAIGVGQLTGDVGAARHSRCPGRHKSPNCPGKFCVVGRHRSRCIDADAVRCRGRLTNRFRSQTLRSLQTPSPSLSPEASSPVQTSAQSMSVSSSASVALAGEVRSILAQSLSCPSQSSVFPGKFPASAYRRNRYLH